MVERKLYKTKLCLLYQKGHCHRQSCLFAHGDKELRGSFDGRRYHPDDDLRDTIERRRSPERRYSPRRYAKDRRQHHGYSPSRSLDKKRRHRKKQLEGQSDFSGSLKVSDGTEALKEGNVASTGSKVVLMDQLKQVESEIKLMGQQRCQLEIYLEERVQEVDNLSFNIKALEAQLYKEIDGSKRVTSKIKKFLKAHARHSRIQEELKRSQAQLQRLGDELGSDITKSGVLEDDLISDEENNANPPVLPNVLERSAAPSNKRPRINLNAANLTNEDGYQADAITSKKPSLWNLDNSQTYNKKAAGRMNSVNDSAKPLHSEAKRKGVKNVSTNSCSADKTKGLDSGLVLPSTSMAAHAVDEVVETIEEEKGKMVGNASEGNEKGAECEFNNLPLPPPPPFPPTSVTIYSQYKVDNENIDVVRYGEEEMRNVV